MMTAREVAARLAVPVGTLAQWRYKREGPAWMKLGKHVRYEKSAVEAWLRQLREQAGHTAA